MSTDNKLILPDTISQTIEDFLTLSELNKLSCVCTATRSKVTDVVKRAIHQITIAADPYSFIISRPTTYAYAALRLPIRTSPLIPFAYMVIIIKRLRVPPGSELPVPPEKALWIDEVNSYQKIVRGFEGVRAWSSKDIPKEPIPPPGILHILTLIDPGKLMSQDRTNLQLISLVAAIAPKALTTAKLSSIDKALALTLVKINGFVIEAFSKDFKNDLDIAKAAMTQNPRIYPLVGMSINTHPDILRLWDAHQKHKTLNEELKKAKRSELVS